MNIKLTVSERIYTLAILNQFKGNLETLVDVMEDIKEIRMAEEEWTKADKQVNTTMDEDGKPVTSWTWNDELGGEKEVQISDETKKYLSDKIKELDDKKELTLQDRAAITLKDKLECKKEKK